MKRLLIVLALSAPMAASAQYKCVENGKTTYSERPCGEGAEKMAIPNAEPQNRPLSPRDAQLADLQRRNAEAEAAELAFMSARKNRAQDHASESMAHLEAASGNGQQTTGAQPMAPVITAEPSPARVKPSQQGDATLFFVLLFFAVFLYFAPLINAHLRRHPSKSAIGALNLLLGWTFLGWVAALVWSYKAIPAVVEAPNSTTHRKCPDCAEFVLRDAKVCKHCGRKLATP